MSTVAAKAPQSKNATIGMAVAGALVLMGVGLWVYQMSAGMSLTGMGDINSWGLYIMSFMFMVGTATGAMIIACIPRAFGSTSCNGVTKIAVWVSICCTVLAIGFVVVDLGHPLKVWELFAYSNLASPLMWDIIVLPVFLIVSIIYLWTLMRAEHGKASEKGVRVMTFVVLAVAILVCTVDAWIFGLLQGREAWNTAMLAPWFIASALSSGLALLLLAIGGSRGAERFGLTKQTCDRLTKVLGALILVDLYFLGCELVTNLFAGAEGAAVVALLTSGPLAPVFYGELVAGLAAACICFTPRLRTPSLLLGAAVLTLVGVFCKRFQFLASGLASDGTAYAGMVTPVPVNTAIISATSYTPSFMEIGVALGVVALGVLVFLIGMRKLSLGADLPSK